MTTIKEKICVPVAADNLAEFLEKTEKAQKVTDIIELRVDYIENLKPNDLLKIKEKIYKKAILTCRTKTEGGFFKGKEVDRQKILEKAIKIGFDFVDIELRTINKIHTTNPKTQIIVSHHNFKETPQVEDLEKIMQKMRKSRADIYKIATMINDKEDNQTLFKLMARKKEKEKTVIIGMGELGKITRVLGLIYGNFLTFASLEEETAPGQISYSKMIELLEELFKNKD